MLLITLKNKQTKKIKTLLLVNNQPKQIHNQLKGVFFTNKKILRMNEEKQLEIYSIDSNEVTNLNMKVRGIWNGIGGKAII